MLSSVLYPAPERNATAYEILYLIENQLRNSIKLNNSTTIHYNATLFALIETAEKIHDKIINEKAARKLYKLIDIRNKVCHMEPNKEKELKQIKDCWKEVVEAYKEYTAD